VNWGFCFCLFTWIFGLFFSGWNKKGEGLYFFGKPQESHQLIGVILIRSPT
jgi:hypothetical protein